jgi:adenylate cyclase
MNDAQSIRDWLIDEAGFLEHGGAVLEGLCTRLVVAGLPVVRATAHTNVVHSERIGVTAVWRRGHETFEQPFGYGPDVRQIYLRSPVRVVHETRRKVELRPSAPAGSDYGITPDLQAAGITHYVAFPLFYTSGPVNVASFATDRPNGFEERHLAFVEALLPALTRVLELKALQRSRRELLQIYVGGLPAERILKGQIRRGDAIVTEAAILLCDLRDSTRLAIELDENTFIATLNRFFDCVVPAVVRQGGDVLKFVGDAVLAIFPPAGAGDCSHCNAAMATASAILAALDDVNALDPVPGGPLRVAIALHEGRLAFGNVGSVERQDFTVVGQDVNLAARLCTLSAELDEPLVVSEQFAASPGAPLRRMGSYLLKGYAAPQAVFAPVRS